MSPHDDVVIVGIGTHTGTGAGGGTLARRLAPHEDPARGTVLSTPSLIVVAMALRVGDPVVHRIG